MTFHIGGLNKLWISKNNFLYFSDHYSFFPNLNDLSVIHRILTEVFRQHNFIFIITIRINHKPILCCWLFYTVFKSIQEQPTSICCSFTYSKCGKEERFSFYRSEAPEVTSCKFFIAIGLNFFLFFFTNVQNSSNSCADSPTFLVRYFDISFACSANAER